MSARGWFTIRAFSNCAEGANLGERLRSASAFASGRSRDFLAARRSSKATSTLFPRCRIRTRKSAATAGPWWATRRDSSIRSTAPASISVPTPLTTSRTCWRASLAGEDVTARVAYYNEQYPDHLPALVRDALQGQVLLHGRRRTDVGRAACSMSAAYFVGLVTPVYKNPEREFARLPFEGTPGRIVGEHDESLQSQTRRAGETSPGDGHLRHSATPAGANFTTGSFPTSGSEVDSKRTLPLVESGADESAPDAARAAPQMPISPAPTFKPSVAQRSSS